MAQSAVDFGIPPAGILPAWLASGAPLARFSAVLAMDLEVDPNVALMLPNMPAVRSQAPILPAGPEMAGRSLPAIVNLPDADGAVSPGRAAAKRRSRVCCLTP